MAGSVGGTSDKGGWTHHTGGLLLQSQCSLSHGWGRGREGLCRCSGRDGRDGSPSGGLATLAAHHADNGVLVALAGFVHTQKDGSGLHQLDLLVLGQQELCSGLFFERESE